MTRIKKNKNVIIFGIVALILFLWVTFSIHEWDYRRGMKGITSSAKNGLWSIYLLQEDFFKKNGEYAPDLDSLKFNKREYAKYQFGIKSSFSKAIGDYCEDCVIRKNSFKIMAVSVNKENLDIWTIDQNKKLHCLKKREVDGYWVWLFKGMEKPEMWQ